MKAIGYVRVSTEEQAKGGVSLAHQDAKIRAYAKLHDITLVRILVDEGVSAKEVKNRPGAVQLIGEVERGEIEAVIIYKLDRLFRNAQNALDISAKFNEKGVAIHSVTERLDTQSAMGRFYFTIAAAFAEMERNLISERTRDALQHKKANGQVYNHVPYGFYKGEDGMLHVSMSEQGRIAWMRLLRQDGLTFQQIADKLNAAGAPTKKEGSKWFPQTVKSALKRHVDLKEAGNG